MSKGNCNKGNHDFNCVCEVVRFIDSIQPPLVSPVTEELCPSGCLRDNLGPVGGAVGGNECNTRPFALLNKDGSPFVASFRDRSPGSPPFDCDTSAVFRVEGFFGDDDTSCCAILRVLFIDDQGDTSICNAIEKPCDLIASDTCIIVDLNCFCAIQCFNDIHVDLPQTLTVDCCD